MDFISMNLPTDNTWTWTQPSSTVDNNNLSVDNNKQGTTMASLNIPNSIAWTWAPPTTNEANGSNDRHNKNNKSRKHNKQPNRRSNRHHEGCKNDGRGGNVKSSDVRRNQAMVRATNSTGAVAKGMKTKHNRHHERSRQHSSTDKNDVHNKKHVPVTRRAPLNRKPATTKISSASKNNHRNYDDTTAPTKTNNRHNQKKRKARSKKDPMDIDEDQVSSQYTSLTTAHADHAKQQKKQHVAKKQRRKMNQNKAKDSLSLEEKEYRKQMMSHA